MSVERNTLGEEKEAECIVCGAAFRKKRYDQKFCSPEHLRLYKYTGRVAWKDRPDRDARNAARKARYQANREAELARNRQWRLDHPDEARARDRAEYHRNKEKHYERSKAYRAAHPEIRNKEYRNARQRRPWLAPLENARNRSLKKGFSFDLTREWCEKNWTDRCTLSGLPFSLGNQTHFPFSPSIDRIDSAKGYTQDNCRFVLFALNSFKGTGTDQQMLEIANSLILHQKAAP